MNIKTLIIALSALLTTAILGVLTIIYLLPDSGLSATSLADVQSKIWVEAAKSLFQLIAIVIIGGSVTALFKAFEVSQAKARKKEDEYQRAAREKEEEYQREAREKEEEYQREAREKAEKLHEEAKFKSEIRVDYLKRVGTSYRVAKAARRALRAVGLTDKHNKAPDALSADQIASYQEQMKSLNEAQLELEALKIEARSLPSLVGLQELPDLLGLMEDYLREVVKEYEKYNPKLLIDSSAVKFVNLRRLKEFTGSASNRDSEGFEESLATPHDKIIELVVDKTRVAFNP